MAMTNPAVRAWDPACLRFMTIIKHGIEEMREEKDVIHYITVYNENHPMPPKPDGVDEGILRGLYQIESNKDAKVRLLGSGPIMLKFIEQLSYLRTGM